jgi:hypothetical protein
MQTLYSPGQALRITGDGGSQISRQSSHEGGNVVNLKQWPPLPARKYSWYSFLLEAESTPGLLICDWVLKRTALADVPFVPHIDLWEPCCLVKVPDGPQTSWCPLAPKRSSPDTHVWVQPNFHTHKECGLRFLTLLHTSYTVDCLTARPKAIVQTERVIIFTFAPCIFLTFIY